MLLNIRNVDVVTEPGVIKTPWADIACLPGFDKQEFRAKFPGLSADEENLAWTKYISDMVFALRAECEKTPILMAHYTIPGCNMESGQTSFFTNFEPVIPREALMAARYGAVLLGHIHRPQIIEGFDNVFYSGAINAMNFNDEGQDRGFWIHEFNEKGTLVKGHRYTTPYRQFHTITWDPDEVGNYIREGAMYLHRTGISEDVTDKIVRVRYSCTSEQKKALNIPLLQKNLYELGAFYVADIEAESTIDITNRGLLSEESDPRLNLKKWLEEKTFKNPDKIVELAEPIIAEAMKQSTTAEIHGVFAKKYEVLGEKPEELSKTLKTLKSAGGTAYNDMIGILDRNVAMVNNSGVFGEIGKSFSGGTAAVKKSAAEGKIDTIAKGLIEKDPSMPYNMALAKAWEAHPELVAEYENEAGY